MQRHATIAGWGHYLPNRIVTNRELESRIDTSDEWIRSRTGIRERRFAEPNETTSSMCAAAARVALERAEMKASDLDLVICATTTPDRLLPATACLIQRAIGAVNAGAFDVNSACTGFLSAWIAGAQFIRAGTYRRVLIVGGETLSRFLNWEDRNTCVLFGDGAGAVVLESRQSGFGLVSHLLGCCGDEDGLLTIGPSRADESASKDGLVHGGQSISMRGNEVYRLAVRTMTSNARRVADSAGICLCNFKAVIAHQANERILRSVQEATELPWEKFLVNVDRYGNTGAASLAISLSEYLSERGFDEAGPVLLTVFGGGFTWASGVLTQVGESLEESITADQFSFIKTDVEREQQK